MSNHEQQNASVESVTAPPLPLVSIESTQSGGGPPEGQEFVFTISETEQLRPKHFRLSTDENTLKYLVRKIKKDASAFGDYGVITQLMDFVKRAPDAEGEEGSTFRFMRAIHEIGGAHGIGEVREATGVMNIFFGARFTQRCIYAVHRESSVKFVHQQSHKRRLEKLNAQLDGETFSSDGEDLMRKRLETEKTKVETEYAYFESLINEEFAESKYYRGNDFTSLAAVRFGDCKRPVEWLFLLLMALWMQFLAQMSAAVAVCVSVALQNELLNGSTRNSREGYEEKVHKLISEHLSIMPVDARTEQIRRLECQKFVWQKFGPILTWDGMKAFYDKHHSSISAPSNGTRKRKRSDAASSVSTVNIITADDTSDSSEEEFVKKKTRRRAVVKKTKTEKPSLTDDEEEDLAPVSKKNPKRRVVLLD